MMRPELLSAQATPVFVKPDGSHAPTPNGAAVRPGALPGIPMQRSTTQEACASAMLALSGGGDAGSAPSQVDPSAVGAGGGATLEEGMPDAERLTSEAGAALAEQLSASLEPSTEAETAE